MIGMGRDGCIMGVNMRLKLEFVVCKKSQSDARKAVRAGGIQKVEAQLWAMYRLKSCSVALRTSYDEPRNSNSYTSYNVHMST